MPGWRKRGRETSFRSPRHQLINRERHNPEHQMTQHLPGMAAHAHAATSEFILEATIDALSSVRGNVSPEPLAELRVRVGFSVSVSSAGQALGRLVDIGAAF